MQALGSSGPREEGAWVGGQRAWDLILKKDSRYSKLHSPRVGVLREEPSCCLRLSVLGEVPEERVIWYLSR